MKIFKLKTSIDSYYVVAEDFGDAEEIFRSSSSKAKAIKSIELVGDAIVGNSSK